MNKPSPDNERPPELRIYEEPRYGRWFWLLYRAALDGLLILAFLIWLWRIFG